MQKGFATVKHSTNDRLITGEKSSHLGSSVIPPALKFLLFALKHLNPL